MPYFEFRNLGNLAAAGGEPGGPPQFADRCADDRIEIDVDLAAPTDARGRVVGTPGYVSCSIRRRFALDGGKEAATKAGMLAPNGSLLLYHVAVMSTMATWNCRDNEDAKWPVLSLELETTNDVPFKYELKRLLIDSWSLEIAGDEGVEQVTLRGFNVKQTRQGGASLTMAMDPHH